jgi:RecJ-like exonuclease
MIGKIISFFSGSSSNLKNCERCGRPCRPYIANNDPGWEAICYVCREEYNRLLEKEIQKQPKEEKCDVCNGSGKVKGYQCTKCYGRGFVKREMLIIAYAAKEVMYHNGWHYTAKWSKHNHNFW